MAFRFDPDELTTFKAVFAEFDADGSGAISTQELGTVMAKLGETVDPETLQKMVDAADTDRSGEVDWNEFLSMMWKARKANGTSAKPVGFAAVAKKVEKVQRLGGTSKNSAEGTTHSYSQEEKVAFCEWINDSLSGDPDLTMLPLSVDDDSLFSGMHNGVLLNKLINSAVPDTVDYRALNLKGLNVYKIHENHTLAINSAKAIGCNVVNVGADDLIQGSPTLVLGIVWQIIRIGLFAQINLHACPGLMVLLHDGETLEDLMSLPADAILLRWFNYHLQEAGSSRRVHNFSGDIKDSEAYTILLAQIAPSELGITTAPLSDTDPTGRANKMLDNAEKMECRKFVHAVDVVKGNPKLNLAFVANLFNTYPALQLEAKQAMEIEEFVAGAEETREERTFRNWMNSLGVKPYVNNLYQDLRDGLVILQLLDKTEPGCVNWKRVNQPPYKRIGGMMKKMENCQYALDISRTMKFSLVNIGGKDIFDGHKMLTLALIWQIMRAYTLSVLNKLSSGGRRIQDKEIVVWCNETLTQGQKQSQIKDFRDSSIGTSRVVFDLVDCIQPGSIDYSYFDADTSEESRLSNAKYAVSMARKIGAGVYCLPEDLVEVKSKMVLTVIACLMAKSLGAA